MFSLEDLFFIETTVEMKNRSESENSVSIFGYEILIYILIRNGIIFMTLTLIVCMLSPSIMAPIANFRSYSSY